MDYPDEVDQGLGNKLIITQTLYYKGWLIEDVDQCILM